MRISDWSSDVCSSDLVQQFDARITQKQIRAPFAGELGIRRVNLGQYLNPGDPVATLTTLDRLFVAFTLPQQDLATLRVGAPVTIKADAWPERSSTGPVTAIRPPTAESTPHVYVPAVVATPGYASHPRLYVTHYLHLPP